MKRLLLIIVLLCGTAYARDAPVSIKSTEVIPGMHLLEGDGVFAGGNITLLSGDDYSMAGDDSVIIPGHGAIANKIDLQVAIDMLVDAEARVAALVLEGKSEEEVLAANPLADYHERWNWPYITTERMTQILYRSLTSS